MAVRADVSTITFAVDARQMLDADDSGTPILQKDVNTERDNWREIVVMSSSSLGGGVLSVEASYEITPVTATDAHWTTIHPDLDALEVGRVYPIRCKATRLAIKLLGATDPDVTILVV